MACKTDPGSGSAAGFRSAVAVEGGRDTSRNRVLGAMIGADIRQNCLAVLSSLPPWQAALATAVASLLAARWRRLAVPPNETRGITYTFVH